MPIWRSMPAGGRARRQSQRLKSPRVNELRVKTPHPDPHKSRGRSHRAHSLLREVITMNRRTAAAALTALAILPLTACSNALTATDELSYQIDQSLSALVIDARAGSIAIEVGDGPITVTEEHSYSRFKAATAHQVQGQTLRLTESGCRDDRGRCDVGYRIRLPKAMSAQINAQAGAVMVNGLAGDLDVATLAGSVEGRGLSSAEVSVRTEAGETSLAFAEAPALVRATTSLGAVELRLPGNAAYAVDVQTTVGDSSVDVDQNSASAHRIKIRSRVGSVKIARHLP